MIATAYLFKWAAVLLAAVAIGALVELIHEHTSTGREIDEEDSDQ